MTSLWKCTPSIIFWPSWRRADWKQTGAHLYLVLYTASLLFFYRSKLEFGTITQFICCWLENSPLTYEKTHIAQQEIAGFGAEVDHPQLYIYENLKENFFSIFLNAFLNGNNLKCICINSQWTRFLLAYLELIEQKWKEN